jgi:hypothetical protein
LRSSFFVVDGVGEARSLSWTVDGVAMGSPLGPLMANAMMCLIEEKLENEGKMPEN